VTGPAAQPPTCVLWVNGARYADGQPAEDPAAPVALTGLRVVWGRDTTIDQPAPATCTFDVLDLPGGARFTAGLTIGARVQVRADALVYPDPTVPTITDPGFETAAAGSAVSTAGTNARPVKVSTAYAHTGAHSARVEPVNGDRAVRVIFPPAPFTPTDPAGWDGVPRTLAGQSWRYGAAVRPATALAAVARVAVHPVTFTRPWPGTERVLSNTAAAGAPDAGGWAVHTGDVTPAAGVWLGVAVDIWPTGPAWRDLPPALTWSAIPPALVWAEVAATYVDDLVMLAPAAGASRAGEVFTGRITDLAAEWDPDVGDAGGTVVRVTAQDDTAELANRYVGAEPWSAEALSARFGRILTAAGQAMQYTVDPAPGAMQVTYRDVDNQSAGGLLADLAKSVGGALWSATSLSTGPYLRLEDINTRAATQTLAMDAGGVIRIVPASSVGGHGLTISACDVLLDPIQWEQDVGDVATRVAIGWKDQTPDPVKPVDKTVTVVDTAAESAIGQRRVQVSTELAVQTDAQSVANSILARLRAGGWRIRGLTYRVDPADPIDAAGIAAVMTILDATTRIGLPILLTDVPAWSPAPTTADVPLYLEGAVLTNDAGAWTLELITSNAVGTGAATAPWNSLPADWSWNEWDPAIRWSDLAGVGPPP
jgi:hypothetical protein